MRFILLSTFFISVTGCSMFQPGPVPVGFKDMVIEVGQPITIPAHQYSALFQYGKQISQRDLTIWDNYCRIRVEKAESQSWQWTKGRYRITGFSWHDDLCSKRDCDLVQRYRLETLAGKNAVEVECRYRYAFGDPWAITGPHLLSPEQLDAVLGEYLKLTEDQGG